MILYTYQPNKNKKCDIIKRDHINAILIYERFAYLPRYLFADGMFIWNEPYYELRVVWGSNYSYFMNNFSVKFLHKKDAEKWADIISRTEVFKMPSVSAIEETHWRNTHAFSKE